MNKGDAAGDGGDTTWVFANRPVLLGQRQQDNTGAGSKTQTTSKHSSRPNNKKKGKKDQEEDKEHRQRGGATAASNGKRKSKENNHKKNKKEGRRSGGRERRSSSFGSNHQLSSPPSSSAPSVTSSKATTVSGHHPSSSSSSSSHTRRARRASTISDFNNIDRERANNKEVPHPHDKMNKQGDMVDEAVAYYARTPRSDAAAVDKKKEPSSPSSSAAWSDGTKGSRIRPSTVVRRISAEFNIKVQPFELEKEGVIQSYKYQQLPPLRVKPLSTQSNVIELFGPNDQAGTRPEAFGGHVYCRSVSTYPWDTLLSAQAERAERAAAAASAGGKSSGSGSGSNRVFAGLNVTSAADGNVAPAAPKLRKIKRVGDPICDVFGVQVYSNRTLVALADGCNWGEKPKKAAQTACQAFLEHMKSKFAQVQDVKTAGHYMLRALAHAHTQIMNTCARDAHASGKTTRVTDGGTTTLLGGVLLELEENEAETLGSKWVFVCVSVGDCKAYLYSPSTQQIIDVTQGGNRSGKADMSDPGGRLGPTVGRGGDADLRNLGLYMAPCEEDSLLLVVSDGVHDNLDPEHLGLSPSDVGVKQDKWVGDWDALGKAKHLFRGSILMQKIRGTNEEIRPTPEDAVNRLLAHCKQVTKRSRQWMVANPSKRLPLDHVNFPGKMDHTTCIAVTVGNRERSGTSQPQVAIRDFEHEPTNKPITVTVAQSAERVMVICRTLAIADLTCSVLDKKIEITLQNSAKKRDSTQSLVPEGFYLMGENEVEKPSKWTRTVSLPCKVKLDSQQTKQIDDQTIVFTFDKTH